jgi:hypothetical protein
MGAAKAKRPPDWLLGWERLLVNRAQPSAVQQDDGSYRWVQDACTPALLREHLAGRVTLALSSLDASGGARWACLDADAPDSLGPLVHLHAALGDLGWPGIVEASRRGGHLWLFCAEVVPAVLLRRALFGVLARVQQQGLRLPSLEVYPDKDTGLGHAVRLPLGVHRQSGRRYPLLDADGLPLRFASRPAAVRFLLALPRVPLHWLQASWDLPGAAAAPGAPVGATRPATTRSAVIRWVDAQVAPLDLLADLAPASAMQRVGKGYLGFCPFHDDAAPQSDGSPGTPSLYVVQDAVYGWSWRCLSTHCRMHAGPLKHSFRLFCDLLGLDAREGIAAARHRWPQLVDLEEVER